MNNMKEIEKIYVIIITHPLKTWDEFTSHRQFDRVNIGCALAVFNIVEPS